MGVGRCSPRCLIVSGDPAPDSTGTYNRSGTYNDSPAWKHESAEWYIWLEPGKFVHYLTTQLGGPTGPEDNFWTGGNADSPMGIYEPKGAAAGNPVVA